jgi:MFS transporter, DHA1 family, multidrug resistance protein
MNTQLSHTDSLIKPVSPPRSPLKEHRIMLILCMCMALQTTGFVMVLPLFARRFSELGAGVELLGASVMAGALAAALAAPFMGALADRYGRRLLVIASLGVYILAFTGYLLASSALAFILLRALAGALTAGLVPAVIGIVADLAPRDRRAQWVGIISGGASFGWVAGPVLGGILYDRWGYAIAVGLSIIMAVVTFLTALFVIPETGQKLARRKDPHWKGINLPSSAGRPNSVSFTWQNFRASLPRCLAAFATLLSIYFTVMFAWAFIEPSFMFYAYDDLGWSSTMLGLVMSTYGIAMMVGEFGLSQMSDRWGRKPVILLGVVLFAAQFIGLAFFQSYIWLSVSFVIAGLGNALFDPALSASILDMSASQHHARLQGIKSTAGSLGNILGPGLAVLLTPFLNPQAIFLVAAGAVLAITVVGLFVPVERPGIEKALNPVLPDPKAVES